MFTEHNLKSGFELLIWQIPAPFMRQLTNQINYLKDLVAVILTGFTSPKVPGGYRLGSYSNITSKENVLLKKQLINRSMDDVHFAGLVFAFWFHGEYCNRPKIIDER